MYQHRKQAKVKRTGRVVYYYVCLLIILIWCKSLMASDFSYQVIPQTPTINSQFSIHFSILSAGTKWPTVVFDPGVIQILKRKNLTKNSVVKFIMGQKKSLFRYEIEYVAKINAIGEYYLKNIQINDGNKIFSHSNIRILVTNTIIGPKNIFLKAELSKKTAFIGSPIDVNYFLYYKVKILTYDLINYPQYKGFIKRFYHPSSREQLVNINGTMYKKSLKYSVRLFGEKEGEFNIDTLKLKIKYRNMNYVRGGTMRKSVMVESDKQSVSIMSLPIEGMPPSFTGLVGKHAFNLKFNKKINDLTLNSEIPIVLQVTGNGALEKFDAPAIYSHPNLDDFEVNSEIKGKTKDNKTKFFSYTIIPRGEIIVPERELILSYFDDKLLSYIEQIVIIPALEISAMPSQITKQKTTGDDNKKIVKLEKKVLLAPIFYPTRMDPSINFFKTLNIFLATIIAVFLIFPLPFFKNKKKNGMHQMYFKELSRNGASYSILSKIINDVFTETSCPLAEKIIKSELNEDTKKYFISLISQEERDYDSTVVNSDNKIKVNKNFFKELLKYHDAKNENHKLN